MFDVPQVLNPNNPTQVTPVDVFTQSQLNSINFTALIGKQFGNAFRAHLGPVLLFSTKATRYQQAVFNQDGEVTTRSTEVDLLNETEAGYLKVRELVAGMQAGVGLSIPNTGIDLDVNYSVPLFTGVYEEGDIEGYLGILSISVGYRFVRRSD
ncbi:MAG: hypothetical protein HC880_07890 [Bacteroidia bacterium]|nr:hypothetical protein [Bacteroidia bacterium]